MRSYLEKFAFKAIFAVAIFFGAALLWLLTANHAAAAGGGDPLNLSKTVSAVSTTVKSTTVSYMLPTTAGQVTHTASATTSRAAQAGHQHKAAQLVTSALKTTTKAAKQVVNQTLHAATKSAASTVDTVLQTASQTAGMVTNTVHTVVPVLPVAPVVPAPPRDSQPSVPANPLGGLSDGMPAGQGATLAHGLRVSFPGASASSLGIESGARVAIPQPQPLPGQPGNAPTDAAGSSASQVSTRPIGGPGFDLLILLAIFTLLAGKALYFRYASAREGVALPSQLPSG